MPDGDGGRLLLGTYRVCLSTIATVIELEND